MLRLLGLKIVPVMAAGLFCCEVEVLGIGLRPAVR